MIKCPHCGADLNEVGIRIYYEAYDDMLPDGTHVSSGDNTWDEALDAECGNCHENVRNLCEEKELFSFNRINYAQD